jgi:hemoglobin/transferrin/lactoferrin receptor protein
MFYRKARVFLLNTTILIGIAATAPAHAAELMAGDAPIYTLPVTTVTATRTAKNPDNLPAYVSVIGQDTLESIQPQEFSQVLGKLANVDTANGARGSAQQPIIRGLDDRRIVIKVDGVRNNFRTEYKGRYFTDPELVKQVDVVRGANSVVDGGGAIAGTIQFVTKDATDFLRPGETYGAYVKAGYGTNGRTYQGTTAVYTANEQADVLAALTASAAGDIAMGRNQSLAYSSSDVSNALFKGNMKLSEASKLTLAASSYYDHGNSTTDPTRSGLAAGYPAVRDFAKQDMRLAYHYQPKDNSLWDLKAQASHSYTELTELVFENPPFFPNAIGRKDLTDYFSNSADIANTSRFDFGGGSHALTYGLDGYHDVQKGRRPGTNRNFLLEPAEIYAAGIFAQNEMTWGDLTLTPGLRYDNYNLKGFSRVGFAGSARRFDTNSDDEVTGKLQASYRLTPVWSVFGTLAQGYRAPTMAEAFSAGSLGQGRTLGANPNLRPEKSLNKEIGLGYNAQSVFATGDRYTSRVTLFHNDVQDLIIRRGNIDGVATRYQYINIDDAYLQGAEWEQRYGIDAWEGSLALSYTDSQGKNSDSVASLNFKEKLSDVPPAKAVLTISRDFDIWGDSDARLSWQTEAALKQTEVPQSAKTDLLQEEAAAYAVHNLYFDWKLGDYGYAQDARLGLAAENIFDTAYRHQSSYVNAPGRNLRVTLSSKF